MLSAIRRVVVLATLVAAAAPAYAVPTIDTTGGTFLPTAAFGESVGATYGQTFAVTGPETKLESFSFRFNDLQGAVVNFAAYVYGWDGTKAIGPHLYASAPRSSSNNGGADGLEVFTFNTGGTELTSGQRYIAFLSGSLFFDGSPGIAVWEFGVSPYSDGSFVYDNNGNDFASLTTQSWDCADACFGGVLDTWFVASFSAPGAVEPAAISEPAAIPEPGSLALAAVALVGLAAIRRRKM